MHEVTVEGYTTVAVEFIMLIQGARFRGNTWWMGWIVDAEMLGRIGIEDSDWYRRLGV